MRFARFLATRYTFRNPRQVARLGVVLALVSVVLGVATMEVALSVVAGFERAVQRKVVGFVGDVQIGTYLPELEDSLKPLPRYPAYRLQVAREVPAVRHLAPYIQKAGILQASESIEGILLKGVDSTWNAAPFAQALVAGRVPAFGRNDSQLDVLVSQTLARTLRLHVGDRVTLFFLEDNVRARRVVVRGIYHTGFEELDEVMVFCDMALLQRILGWRTDEVQGFEAHLAPDTDLDGIEATADRIHRLLPADQRARPVQTLYHDIFAWLQLQHQNVLFILILMTVVAVVNMSSAILILITERTRSIGLLRALGTTQGRVQGVFLWQAFYLVSIGVVAGNLLGLTLLWLQQETGLIRLDSASYFVQEVPVAWVWGSFAWTNLAVTAICTVCMVLPTWAVARIQPARALRF